MTLVIPPRYAEATWILRNTGDPVAWNVTCGLYMQSGGPFDHDIAQFVYNAFRDTWLAKMPPEVSLTGVVLAVGQDGGPPLRLEHNSTATGGENESKLPQNCALLMRKTTARAGRRGKGRMFLPNVLNEGQVDTVGVIVPNYYAALNVVATQFFAALTAPNGEQELKVVLLHNSEGAGSTLPDVVTAFSVDQEIATQRRRLR